MATIPKSALSLKLAKTLKDIEQVDLVVGIPAYNCASTIGFVVSQVTEGLSAYFPDSKSLILVSDGGSTDGTNDVVKKLRTPPNCKLVVGRYVGLSGKGTAIKAVLEAVQKLNAQGMAMVDADLTSITLDWMRLLVEPVCRDTDLVTPLYSRFKYDGTITNFVCYPFTRAVYGKRIRQPIGGDFGISRKLVEKLLHSSLWSAPYVPRFGIDIFLTHTAIAERLGIKEAMLGVKTHEAKDPATHLAPMFKQVVGSMFTCMKAYESYWRAVRKTESVPIVGRIATFPEPKPFRVNAQKTLRMHKARFRVFARLLRSKLSNELFDSIETLQSKSTATFRLPAEVWVKSSYELASAFKTEPSEDGQNLLLEAFQTLWIGRVASFIFETSKISVDEAEERIHDESRLFEEMKDYLLERY